LKTILKNTNIPKFNETKRLSHIYRQTGILRNNRKLIKIADAMGLCGKYPRLQYRVNAGGNYDLRNNYYHCGYRQCPACSERRNREKREKIEQMLIEKGTKNFIFLTLTMPERYSIDGCREQFDFLSKAISDLSRTKIFKSGVIGSFRALEANSKDDGMVNPHSHLLLEMNGSDLRQNKHVLNFIYEDSIFLSVFNQYLLNHGSLKSEELYKKILMRLKKGRLDQLIWSALALKYGLGSVCYVKEVRDYKGGVRGLSGELCKYITKTMKISDSNIVDFYLELHQKNVFSSSGTIRKFNTSYVLKKDQDLKQNGPWQEYGECNQIAERALAYRLQPDIQAFVVMVKGGLISSEFLRNFKLNVRV